MVCWSVVSLLFGGGQVSDQQNDLKPYGPRRCGGPEQLRRETLLLGHNIYQINGYLKYFFNFYFQETYLHFL